MEVYYVKDIYGNFYNVVNKNEFIQKKVNPLYKDEYFGYMDENNKFVTTDENKDKQPQATFFITP